jgi:hypothetical protein
MATHPVRDMLSRNKREQLVSEIREYLVKHRHAADTCEGIADWWLAASPNHLHYEDVLDALTVMVERGELVRIRVGETVVYTRGDKSSGG